MSSTIIATTVFEPVLFTWKIKIVMLLLIFVSLYLLTTTKKTKEVVKPPKEENKPAFDFNAAVKRKKIN